MSPALTKPPVEKSKIRLSVHIHLRWYTAQEILTVENNNTDITFTFKCDKGTVTLNPGEEWEHGYINGATAIQTMSTIEVLDAHRGDNQLYDGNSELEFVKFKVGWTAKADQWATRNPLKIVRLSLGDPSTLLEF